MTSRPEAHADSQNHFDVLSSRSLSPSLCRSAWDSGLIQILETTSYAIALAYASRNRFPFSTYGENLFLTVQNVIITLLIIYFSGTGGALRRDQGGNRAKAATALAIVIASGVFLKSEILCPPSIRMSPSNLTLTCHSWGPPSSHTAHIPHFQSTPNHLQPPKQVHRQPLRLCSLQCPPRVHRSTLHHKAGNQRLDHILGICNCRSTQLRHCGADDHVLEGH